MSRSFTSKEIHALEAVISAPRFGTYLRSANAERHGAMQLYCWNTEISAAFYVSLQFCELAVRNGAVKALEQAFGPTWHLNRGFYNTLARLRGPRRYQPRSDVENLARRLSTAGKVVAELKFAFWQYLFVVGQDQRLWLPYFPTAFPGCDSALTIAQARADIHQDIEVIRRLRNRIAHHEPIFSRNLDEDRDRIRKLIEWRNPDAAVWLDSIETVTNLLDRKPSFA